MNFPVPKRYSRIGISILFKNCIIFTVFRLIFLQMCLQFYSFPRCASKIILRIAQIVEVCGGYHIGQEEATPTLHREGFSCAVEVPSTRGYREGELLLRKKPP